MKPDRCQSFIRIHETPVGSARHKDVEIIRNNDTTDDGTSNSNEPVHSRSDNKATQPLAKHTTIKKNRTRMCKIAGCCKIIKSQGLCQRHGAKIKCCRVTNCSKQAQGGYDGMCASHFSSRQQGTSARSSLASVSSSTTSSHYSTTLVQSQSLKTNTESNLKVLALKLNNHYTPNEKATNSASVHSSYKYESVYERLLPLSIVASKPTSPSPSGNQNEAINMPIAQHLEQGYARGLPFGWHRDNERMSRRLQPVCNKQLPFEDWETDLVWVEILLLTGAPDIYFMYLAHAWGRENKFHRPLALLKCQKEVHSIRSSRQTSSHWEQDNQLSIAPKSHGSTAITVAHQPTQKRLIVDDTAASLQDSFAAFIADTEAIDFLSIPRSSTRDK